MNFNLRMSSIQNLLAVFISVITFLPQGTFAKIARTEAENSDCGDSGDKRYQVPCCKTMKPQNDQDTDAPPMERSGTNNEIGDLSVTAADGDNESFVFGKRMDDLAETYDEAVAMCKDQGAGWNLCPFDDLMSGQIFFQLSVDEEVQLAMMSRGEMAANPTNDGPSGVWVRGQCEGVPMMSSPIESEAVEMNGEFNMSNDSGSAIDTDSMLIGAGIGAVVMLLVVGLLAMIMKWRKTTAKGQESDLSKVVDAPNVVHVEDDSVEVAKVEGAATVEVVDAEVPTPAGAAVTVAV